MSVTDQFVYEFNENMNKFIKPIQEKALSKGALFAACLADDYIQAIKKKQDVRRASGIPADKDAADGFEPYIEALVHIRHYYASL